MLSKSGFLLFGWVSSARLKRLNILIFDSIVLFIMRAHLNKIYLKINKTTFSVLFIARVELLGAMVVCLLVTY